MTVLAPHDEAGVAAAVADAAASREPLAIAGRGTKHALLRPVQAARTLSTRALTGITLYRPQELVLSARAGTPLAEIEAALTEHRQMLPAEPPDLSALFAADSSGTIGGMVATNLSGPRRITAGATRDNLLGIRAVNGGGEVFRSGGRVLKNVTGLDLCKLLAGSHGTLGVLTEVTLKVLPRPERAGTLVVPVADHAAGVAALSAGLGSPFGVSGAALLPRGWAPAGLAGATACLRIEDVAESVAYRLDRLRDALGGRVLDDDASGALWLAIRDAAPLEADPGDAVWRVSVRPSAAPAAMTSLPFPARLLFDWGGGLVWIAGPATEAAHAAVATAAAHSGGTHVLFRAPEPLRAAVAVIPAEPPPLAAIAARVRAVLDPAGILNPGRMRAGG